jgi:hypothetical protein
MRIKENILSKDLMMVAANEFIFFSTQQMNPSLYVVSLTYLENSYCWSVEEICLRTFLY